jgi:hypothetical protein
MNKKRTIEKWNILWPVNFSRDNNKTYWVFFEKYFEDQEYELWNDWQEGVGDHWKTTWRCKVQYKHK